ncbi:hypothetical protein RchiOBHm_Chr7g0181931 [Rosa chinensis]|uniref:Uncharacterized protein n=1 Tax=Rosa chinensis TaxID=74649 RepID=A0A2P6P2R3_ROSCH|nr:hypothetical protein RchiOBHm_Chr7g0181931 [Rosa chinensis]
MCDQGGRRQELLCYVQLKFSNFGTQQFCNLHAYDYMIPFLSLLIWVANIWQKFA